MSLLTVQDLVVGFGSPSRDEAPDALAVDRLSFTLEAGETLAIVGESGCGKSVTALAIMRLLNGRHTRVTGSIKLDGRELSALSPRAMRAVRGRDIGMVFQDPMSSLNPVMRIGDQLIEAIRAHRPTTLRAARAEALALLERVRIPEAERRLLDYPHRLSGGMRQRVAIAMALAGRPRILIADEPTTALDVTIQAQILQLLAEIQRADQMAVVLISHDLGVVSEIADRVMVMYAGRKVEEQSAAMLFAQALHPYTQGLIAARPRLTSSGLRNGDLPEIPGLVPLPGERTGGCAFAPRCPRAGPRCETIAPALRPFEFGGYTALAACHYPEISTAIPASRLVEVA